VKTHREDGPVRCPPVLSRTLYLELPDAEVTLIMPRSLISLIRSLCNDKPRAISSLTSSPAYDLLGTDQFQNALLAAIFGYFHETPPCAYFLADRLIEIRITDFGNLHGIVRLAYKYAVKRVRVLCHFFRRPKGADVRESLSYGSRRHMSSLTT
jgi:hypothetical protein